jgi:hypothetical protein
MNAAEDNEMRVQTVESAESKGETGKEDRDRDGGADT